ncbi:MAG: Fe-S cluster assembly sulfur transfer protein SufU [Motilibacteraceae bacterium]
MKLDSLYQDLILDHYKHPRHRGLREPFEAEVHHVNPTCGDEVTLRVHLAAGEDGPVVADVSYEGEGCSISQASTSVMTELVTGRPVARGLELSETFRDLMGSRTEAVQRAQGLEDQLEDAVAFAGVAQYPSRVKCALLGWMAWKDAVSRAVAEHATTSDHLPEGSTR